MKPTPGQCFQGCGEMGACHPNREALVVAVEKFVAYYDGQRAGQLGNGAARRFLDQAKAALGKQDEASKSSGHAGSGGLPPGVE